MEYFNQREEELTYYSFRKIRVGEDVMNARPIIWDAEPVDSEGHDKNGRIIIPIKFETTCPKCGYLIQFDAQFVEVACDNCKTGTFKLLYDEFDDPFCDPGIAGVDFAAEVEPFEI